jgi:putative flippase GtrA
MVNFFQLCKFAAVGCVNTFIDWAVYLIIFKVFPGESAFFYLIAKGFSYFCGIINSFFLNRFWTFRDSCTENEGGRFVKFILVNAVSLGFNSASFYIFLNLALNQTMALFLATLITFALNYTLNKFWVFRKDKMVVKTTGG